MRSGMARYPVTVEQFRAFVVQSGHEVPPEALEGVVNHPIVGVSWHDALAYGRWLTGRLRELAQSRVVDDVAVKHSGNGSPAVS